MDIKPLRDIKWIGDSLDNLKDFPDEVKKEMGDALQFAQRGQTADSVKAFKGVGSGVFEIVSRFDKNAYRAVYAVKIGDDIYVLHAFQKKSPKGIKTAQKDVDLIKKRYKKAVEIEKEKDHGKKQ
jgi:phage-related protein